MLFQYHQSTGGEKKASGTGLPIDYTKIVGYCIASGTVVYLGGVVERVVAMSKSGNDEERKSLEKVEKMTYHMTKGGSDGILSSWRSWLWPN